MPILLTLLLALAVAGPATPAPASTDTPSPTRMLGLIRAKFRSHRPPPPYVVYTIERKQNISEGYPDYLESYTYHVWLRSSDRGALARKVYRDYFRGFLEFQRPAFNEARDPGPPTADLFEPAPLHPQPVSFVPTPEPNQTPLPVIGQVTVITETDYNVVSMTTEGSQLHLVLEPKRDPEHNRLRELFVDKSTLELQKLVASDRLFVEHGSTYSVTFTIAMGMLQGIPVVTDIHGVVGDNYNDDGKEVDYHFRDISFPPSLPDWYFDQRLYAQHEKDAPL